MHFHENAQLNMNYNGYVYLSQGLQSLLLVLHLPSLP